MILQFMAVGAGARFVDLEGGNGVHSLGPAAGMAGITLHVQLGAPMHIGDRVILEGYVL